MKRVSEGGFTIVETMIVLGITGVLFLSLMGMVSGQQSKTRFKSAMTDIVTKIQSQINEVSTGYYPSTGNFRCRLIGGALNVDTTATALGTNSDCTFLGRAMMFGTGGTAAPEQYKVQTLLGSRRAASGDDPSTLREAQTRALAPGTLHPFWPDRSSTETLLFGTRVAWMCSVNGGSGCSGGSGENIVGFAIVASPNQQLTYSDDGTTESGTIIPSIIPIPGGGGSNPGASPAQGVDLLAFSLGVTGGNAVAADASDGPVKLCFLSGTSNQSGLVTIGDANSTTSVSYTIHNSSNCT